MTGRGKMQYGIILIILIIVVLFLPIDFVYSQVTTNYIGFRKVDYEKKTQNASIKTFDISSNGLIAIGFSTGVINVFDESGSFLYGFVFGIYGSYVFELDEEDNIVIYLARDDAKIVFDLNGNFIDMEDIDTASKFDELYMGSLSNDNKNRYYDGSRYTIKYKWFKSTIYKDSGNGDEIFYEISDEKQKQDILLMLIAIPVIASVFLLQITKQMKNKNREGDGVSIENYIAAKISLGKDKISKIGNRFRNK